MDLDKTPDEFHIITNTAASNNWVVHGNFTTTGKPILCGDPHLDTKIPAFWQLMEVSFMEDGEMVNMIGGSVPGVPGIIIGKNNHMAWSITAPLNDNSDLFKEKLSKDGNSYFVDMGMNSSNFTSEDYQIFTPNSGYLFTGGGSSGQQSDLFIGTSNPASDIIFFTGGVEEANQRGMFNGATGNFLLNTATDTGYLLNVNGTSYLGGATTFGSTVVLNADPSAALQAATKQYVDGQVAQGFTVHTPVRVVANTYTGTNSTYNNGTAGVGATLTATINGALNIDGVTPSVGDRVLLRALSTASHNGVYSVTDAGSSGTPWVLTRATDFDTPAVGNIANNAYFFVSAGTSYKGYAYVLSQLSAITVGTTALPFVEFASQAAYTVNSPLELVGTTLSLTGTVAATNGGTGTNTVATGDLLYGSAANTWSKLSLGSAYKSIVVNASGTQLEWNAVALNQASAVSGQLAIANGGTGASSASAALASLGAYAASNPSGFITSTGSISGNAATATTATTATTANALNSANTYSVTKLTATPNTSGVSTGITVVNGDLTTYRSGGTTGVVYLSSSGSNYLYWDGANYNLNAGNLVCTGNITAYSDETLKTDWRDLPEDFLTQLAGLKHGIYTRIDSGDAQAGISAQKLQAFLPQVVQKDEQGKLSVAYGNAAMVSAVQLAKRLVALEAVVAKLVD